MEKNNFSPCHTFNKFAQHSLILRILTLRVVFFDKVSKSPLCLHGAFHVRIRCRI